MDVLLRATIRETEIKKNFFSLLYFLKGVADFVSKIHFDFDNPALIRASKLTVVPVPFKPFIRIMENRLGRNIPEDFKFTTQEVKDSDDLASIKYSIVDFDFSSLRLDYLISSAVKTFDELGFFTYSYVPSDIDTAITSYKVSTSAGFPTFQKKGTTIAIDDTREWLISFLSSPSLTKILLVPTACFHRFQYRVNSTGGLDKKIRQVWALPFRILSLQALLLRDLLIHCIRHVNLNNNLVSSWGLRGNPGVSDVIVTRMRRLQSKYNCNLISLDVSGFDQSVPSWLYPLFFSGLLLVFPPNIHTILKYVMAYECFTPYCLRSGKIRFQKRGIPSGSLLTQLFGTFVTRLIINYTFFESTKGKRFAGELANCLGDDNLVLEHEVKYSHLLSVYKRFGLIVSIDKTKVSGVGDPFDYLGITWDSENRPTKQRQWYIARFACPSRFYNDADVSVSELQTFRCISLSMQLYGGMQEFEYLVGYADKVYKRLLNNVKSGQPALVRTFDSSGALTEQTVPLRDVLAYGWRYFGGPEFDLNSFNTLD